MAKGEETALPWSKQSFFQGTDVRQRRAPAPDTAAQKDVPCKTPFLRSLLSLIQQHAELTGEC